MITGVSIKADWLNNLMDFDHVIEVHPDGTVSEPANVYAPDLFDGEVSDGWTLLDGYSGQYSYSGPIMHASEYVGGRMAADILAKPGLYVCLIDTPADGSEPEGWAVAYRESREGE